MRKYMFSRIKEDLTSFLGKSRTTKNAREVLSHSIFTLDDLPQNAFQFHFAPIVSAEVERLFSTMTALLSPQRLNLNFESLKMHLMVLWNTEFVNSNLWKRFF